MGNLNIAHWWKWAMSGQGKQWTRVRAYTKSKLCIVNSQRKGTLEWMGGRDLC